MSSMIINPDAPDAVIRSLMTVFKPSQKYCIPLSSTEYWSPCSAPSEIIIQDEMNAWERGRFNGEIYNPHHNDEDHGTC